MTPLPAVLPQGSDQSDRLYALTDLDRRYLNYLIQFAQKFLVARGGENFEIPSLYAPEVLIFKLPDSGIPSRVGTSPGKAECEVFRIKPVDELDPYSDDWDVTQLDAYPDASRVKEWVFNIYPVKFYGASGRTIYFRGMQARTGEWLCEKPTFRHKAKAKQDINPASSGDTGLYIDGSEVETVTAYNNWMNNGVKIADTVEGIIEYMEDEDKWVWVEAECNP